jgi:hypothetical protein
MLEGDEEGGILFRLVEDPYSVVVVVVGGRATVGCTCIVSSSAYF